MWWAKKIRKHVLMTSPQTTEAARKKIVVNRKLHSSRKGYEDVVESVKIPFSETITKKTIVKPKLKLGW